MKQAQKIIELLEDTSFPQILLIDGAWGSGKTYYVKNELIDILKEKFEELDVYYFSLYGIYSIEDFKNKVISLKLTNTEDSSLIEKNIFKIADSLGSNLGEKGVGGILNGISGALKYKVYSGFDSSILILDDLERISDDFLIKNILGECLNLVESNKIKVIIIANEKELECKNDVEKVLPDVYKFKLNHEEIIEIIKIEFSELFNDKLYDEISSIVKEINLKNIRVLKRAIIKFKKIHSEIDDKDGLIKKEAYPYLLEQIIKICYAKYECGFEKENIIEAITENSKNLWDKEYERNDKYERLYEIYVDGFHEKLISYCCDETYDINYLVNELDLPIESDLLTMILSDKNRNLLSNDKFNKGIELLESHIRDINLNILKWFYVCDTYMEMLDKKIIKSENFSKENIINSCDTVHISNFSPLDTRHRTPVFYDKNIEKIYFKKKKELDKKLEKNISTEFVNKFKTSWKSIYKEPHDLRHKAFLQDIKINELLIAFENWNNSDMFEFSSYMEGRYNFYNIEDYFKVEMKILKESIPEIEGMIDRLGFGLKSGHLLNIKNTFEDAYTRMEINLNQKEDKG